MKENPLETNRKVLIWLCMCPADKSTNKQENRAHVICIIIVCGLVLSCAIASAVFFLKFVSIDLEESLYTLFPITGDVGLLYVIAAALILRDKILYIFNKLSDIYEAYKDDESYRFLSRTNNTCELMWDFYFKFAMGGFLVNSVTSTAASILYSWFIYGHFESNHVYHTYKLTVPWSMEHLIGYLAKSCYDILIAEAYFLTDGSILLLFISMCLNHLAFYKMYRHKLHKLDEPDKIRDCNKFLKELIQLQIQAKNWFLESVEVYSQFLMVKLICSMIYSTCTIFQLDLQLKHLNLSVIPLLIATVIGMSNLFLYCFFGQKATESYKKMADSLYESNWHELPIGKQKYFILMIGNLKKPIYYHGFGIAILDLQTYCKLLKAVCTYYMAFKTLTSK